MNRLGAEKTVVQDTLLEYACEIGWEYISPEDAALWRGGEGGLIFRDVFADRMARLNDDFIDTVLIGELAGKLERLPARIEGNLQAWEYLQGLKTLFVPEERRERNVRLLDEDVRNNVFQVTDEFTYVNGTYHNRYDVVFLINGVPLLFVETKAAHKISGIAEALDQVSRYHRETPEALTLFQIFTLTHMIKFYYSATWNTSAKHLLNWKSESGGADYEALVKSFFDRERVLGTILHFIMFTRQDDELKKVVLRPHQMRAVKKITARAADRSKSRALIWHTQGSGKTYTMIVAAKRILETPTFRNPTVLMLVDRNELQSQLFNNLESVGFEATVVTKSKRHLRELLRSDHRGLIVTMIHKFEGMPQDINTRKNLYVLVDEAHRTTGGDLGNFLMGALPNATYIGFTGTPIDRTARGQGTFVTFGLDDPPHGYLDKYGIAESIEDGATVKLHYRLAPNELLVDKDTLEREFLSLREAEGVSDIESLNKVLEKAVNLRNMLKNPERVQKVAELAANHYREYVEPMGYKAFMVAVDREACALYKEELDRHLPKEYSEVVFSPGHNDPEKLRKFHISETEEKRIRKAFRNPDQLPKILIVTEKLLTGYDAPVLYCIYLDKPMRDHVLLQTIARVNRPYEDEVGRPKTCGFVLDFVGIFDKLEKALAFDSGDVTGVVQDIEILKERFSDLMDDAKEQYLSIVTGYARDKAVERVLEYFLDEETRHEFYEFFKEVSDIYEILSPDAFLRPFIDDFDTLARMYRMVREAYDPGLEIDREFTRKTARLVQEHTHTGPIRDTLETYEIDSDTIKRIEESGASDAEKIFNLLRSIGVIVDKEAVTNPYLISIGEKAEQISQLYKQRQKDTRETLNELKRLIDEINTARKEQSQKNMSPEVFSIYWILKDGKDADAENHSYRIKEIFEKYPHWKTSAAFLRNLRTEMLKIFITANYEPKDALQTVNKILSVLIKV